MTTIIETNRLILRTWKQEDSEAYFQINQDPKVIQFLGGPLTMEQVTDFITKKNNHFEKHGYTLWAVELKKTGELLGFIGLNYTDWKSHFTPAVEIGWRLGSQYWGKGYATEGAKVVLDYGFKKCNLQEIVSFSIPSNLPSIRVMEKIGLKRDLKGDFAHPKLPPNHPLSHHILYRLTKKEYTHPQFRTNIINLHGDTGESWLRLLPKMTNEFAIKYELSQLSPVTNLSYHYVMTGLQGDRPIILKLGLDIEGLKHEGTILNAFSGFGVVKIIAQEEGLLLLERAIPGISLTSYFPEKDDEAINITANVIKHLHTAPIPPNHTFPHIKDWLAALDKDWPIPAAYLQHARQLRDDLLQTITKEVLLHGDLHHDNILSANKTAWVVIDPKGVIGEPAYEIAAFIRNPIPELLQYDNAQASINNRIIRFSEALGLSKKRILDWCFVQAVLAWIWALEDNNDPVYFKQLTEFFERMTNV